MSFQRLIRRLLSGAALLAAPSALMACDARPRVTNDEAPTVAAGEDRLVVFNLARPLPESLSGGLLPTPVDRTYAGLLANIERVNDNSKAKGFLLRLGASSHNWAQTEELGRAFGELRASGRPVYCHADGLDNAGLWLAAASCDKIWLSPAGSVDSVGIAAQSLYFKGLFDRLKVKPEFLHAGRFKSAAETFTREGPSEEAEESLRYVLGSLRSTWLSGIAASRTDPKAREAAEAGPWFPQAAKAIGLIDEIGYESEVRAALKKETSVEGFVPETGADTEGESASELAELIRLLAGGAASFDEPHIAVLTAAGGISMDAEGGFGETGIAARSFIKVIRRLKERSMTKAVVLRVDSPGGSALASDLLWHELRLLADEKPLITSVGSMAASGGYYMACAAKKIVAERTSIVGSIGVVGGKFVLDDALAEYGVFAHIFTPPGSSDAGVPAAYMSPFVSWDDATRARIRDQMEDIYSLFIDRVSQGRSMSVEQVREVAEGRVWTGEQGLERQLVDQIGGLQQALELARVEAGLPEQAPVTLEGDVDTLFDLLGLSDDADEAEVKAVLQQKFSALPSFYQQLSSGQRQHLQSLLPLMHGERVVTALPFVLTVH